MDVQIFIYFSKEIIVNIENGTDDHLVPDEAARAFKDEMNAQGIDWTFKVRWRCPHPR